MKWLLVLSVLASAAVCANESIWQQLTTGGQVLFIRHAETAQLAFGRSKAWPALANLFGRSSESERQVKALRPRIAAHRGKDNLVLVSHGSTALALTGEHPGMGEMLVLTPAGNGFRLAGRLAVP